MHLWPAIFISKSCLLYPSEDCLQFFHTKLEIPIIYLTLRSPYQCSIPSRRPQHKSTPFFRNSCTVIPYFSALLKTSHSFTFALKQYLWLSSCCAPFIEEWGHAVYGDACVDVSEELGRDYKRWQSNPIQPRQTCKTMLASDNWLEIRIKLSSSKGWADSHLSRRKIPP